VWLTSLAVGCAFGSFSFWTPRRWDNPLSDGLFLSHETYNTELCPGLDATLALI
jgi:hypothetical protein